MKVLLPGRASATPAQWPHSRADRAHKQRNCDRFLRSQRQRLGACAGCEVVAWPSSNRNATRPVWMLELPVAELANWARPCASSWRLWRALTAIQLSHLWAVEQTQQSLEPAAIDGGGVELEGKSASIKSISQCIHSSNALPLFSCSISFSICTLPFFRCSISLSSCFSRISLAGSRRQLSIRKNERKGESDEPDAPLLWERELAVGEVDVVIGGEKSNQANNAANNGFQQGFAVEPQPPPGRRRIQIPRVSIHPKQPAPIPHQPA
jgi:hypothetical protein